MGDDRYTSPAQRDTVQQREAGVRTACLPEHVLPQLQNTAAVGVQQVALARERHLLMPPRTRRLTPLRFIPLRLTPLRFTPLRFIPLRACSEEHQFAVAVQAECEVQQTAGNV